MAGSNIMDLETLYKVLSREQTTGYKDSSVLGSFEEFVSDWCNRMLLLNPDQQMQKALQDIRSMAEGYSASSWEMRERKIAEIGRILLSLRDLLQQASYSQERDKPTLHKEKGIEYKQEGNFLSAVAEFEKALELNPNDAFALSHLAHVFLYQNRLEESKRLIDKALKVDPTNPFAHTINGEILFTEGRLEEAETAFEEVLNLRPDDTYVHSKLGVIYRKLGKIGKALSILNRGLEINPDDPSLRHALGDVYAYLGRDEDAIAEYQKAVELDPGDDYAFRGLLSSKTKGKDIGLVIQQLQKILKIPSRSQNPHLHALLARYLKQDNQYEEAIAELRESVRLQPRSSYFRTQLALCYSKLEQYNKVIDLLEPINTVRPHDPIIVHTLAKAYEKMGRIEDARTLLIEALYAHPNEKPLRSALMALGKLRRNGRQSKSHRNSKAGL